MLEAGNGLPNVMRLVKNHVQIDRLGNPGQYSRERALYALDGLYRVCPGLPINRDVNLASAIDVDDVGLYCKGVLDRTHVFYQDRGAVFDFDRKITDLLDLRRHPPGVDLVVQIADLGVPGRYEDVGAPQRPDNVGRPQP